MASDFPFLYEGEPEDDRYDDGVHRELDNISPEQYLQDQVVGAYEMYLRAKGMDPEKYTLKFEIEDEQTTLGQTAPVVTQQNLHEVITEYINTTGKLLNDVTSLGSLVPTLIAITKAAQIPQGTKDAAIQRIERLADVGASTVDHVVTLVMMAKELNAIVNTNAMIENARIENLRTAKDRNDSIGNAKHDRDVQQGGGLRPPYPQS